MFKTISNVLTFFFAVEQTLLVCQLEITQNMFPDGGAERETISLL